MATCGRACAVAMAKIRARRLWPLPLVALVCVLWLLGRRLELYSKHDAHFDEERRPCNGSFGNTLADNMAAVSNYPLHGADSYLATLGVTSTFVPPTRHTPVIGTAASSNHYFESLLMLENVERTVYTTYPDVRIYYYDLGLTETQKTKLKTFCFITFRRFPFEDYPPHVGDLYGYTWKPIIIQTLLHEFGFVMWLDASVRFSRENLDSLFTRAITTGIMFRNGFYKIVAHTDQDTFSFLDEDACIFSPYNEIEANFLLVYRTQFINDYVMKPLLSCALLDGCMVTRNSASLLTSCTTHARYGECHRFDQSVLSIIMTRLHQDLARFDIPEDVNIHICRGIDISHAPDMINRLWYRVAYWYTSNKCTI